MVKVNYRQLKELTDAFQGGDIQNKVVEETQMFSEPSKGHL